MERIVLGSGKTYICEFAGGALPDDATIETSDNLLGLIQGGASVEYSASFYETKDDLGLVKKIILTDEEVKFLTGIMTWNGSTLKKLCSTARVTETAGKRTVKIGGISNSDGKNYLLRFVHEDKADGDIRVTIYGKNKSGFTLAFTKDKETVINAEFSAMTIDEEGTLLIFEEEIVSQENASGE